MRTTCCSIYSAYIWLAQCISGVDVRICVFLGIVSKWLNYHQAVNAIDSILWTVLFTYQRSWWNSDKHITISPWSVHRVIPAGREPSNLIKFRIFAASYRPTHHLHRSVENLTCESVLFRLGCPYWNYCNNAVKVNSYVGEILFRDTNYTLVVQVQQSVRCMSVCVSGPEQ